MRDSQLLQCMEKGMVFLAWASALVTGRRAGKSRGRRLSTAALIADLLFYRDVGPLGIAGRIIAMGVVAVFSYFTGAALAAVVLKAPVTMAVLTAAGVATLAIGDRSG